MSLDTGYKMLHNSQDTKRVRALLSFQSKFKLIQAPRCHLGRKFQITLLGYSYVPYIDFSQCSSHTFCITITWGIYEKQTPMVPLKPESLEVGFNFLMLLTHDLS